jgi:hypothetical protein
MMNVLVRWYLKQVLSRPIIHAVQWNEAERAAFDLFCRTSCGIKLFEFLRQIVASKTFNAVYRNSVSANAEARGTQDILALLHRLRVFPLEESSFTELEESGQPPVATGVRKSDDWRFLGGRGAIG